MKANCIHADYSIVYFYFWSQKKIKWTAWCRTFTPHPPDKTAGNSLLVAVGSFFILSYIICALASRKFCDQNSEKHIDPRAMCFR